PPAEAGLQHRRRPAPQPVVPGLPQRLARPPAAVRPRGGDLRRGAAVDAPEQAAGGQPGAVRGAGREPWSGAAGRRRRGGGGGPAAKAKTEPLKLPFLPAEMAAPLNSYSVPVTGLLLMLSGVFYFGWRPSLAAVPGAAVGILGPTFGVPAVDPLSASQLSLII